MWSKDRVVRTTWSGVCVRLACEPERARRFRELALQRLPTEATVACIGLHTSASARTSASPSPPPPAKNRRRTIGSTASRGRWSAVAAVVAVVAVVAVTSAGPFCMTELGRWDVAARVVKKRHRWKKTTGGAVAALTATLTHRARGLCARPGRHGDPDLVRCRQTRAAVVVAMVVAVVAVVVVAAAVAAAAAAVGAGRGVGGGGRERRGIRGCGGGSGGGSGRGGGGRGGGVAVAAAAAKVVGAARRSLRRGTSGCRA